jgi:transposase-like protein
MKIQLHANTTTTPRTRAYIQSSTAPVKNLAQELGVSQTTIYCWRQRQEVEDRSHTPQHLPPPSVLSRS